MEFTKSHASTYDNSCSMAFLGHFRVPSMNPNLFFALNVILTALYHNS